MKLTYLSRLLTATLLATTASATGLDIEKNFGGSLSSGSFATANGADFDFNTLAFSFNNAGDYSAALDNISVTVIPEPATIGLMGIALLSMLAFRRRKA